MWVLFALFFMFTNFYQSNLHDKTRVHKQIYNEPYAKSRLKIHASLHFSYGYWKCINVEVLKLDTQVLPIVLTIECKAIIHIERRN